MFERIKQQILKPQTFLNIDAPLMADKGNQEINSSLYPLALDYYHDLNPCFSFNINSLALLKKFPIITFRDGAFSFASFMTQNHAHFTGSDQLILIHKEIEHFAPSHLKKNFLSYQMTQTHRLNIKNAKRIVIVGVLSDQVLEDGHLLEEKLSLLDQISDDATIQLYLHSRKGPFQQFYQESTLIEPFKWKLFQRLKRQPVFLTSSTLLNLNNLGDTFVINLQPNRFMIADTYLDYLFASKGATISDWNLSNFDNSELFTHPISLYHQIEISPIQKESVYPDLILKKKLLNRNNLITDGHYWSLARQIF